MQASQTNTGIGELAGSPSHLAAQPLDKPLSPWCLSTGKRVFDLAIACGALAAALPIMLLVALAIKLSSPGPVLFRQKRIGRDGRAFELLKFRSMCVAADQSGPGLTCRNDPRIFPLGRLLRKWKLDELPQLFNVLAGEMSLVGPRPDLPEFCATVHGSEQRVFLLRPGITGAASVLYRHEEQVLASAARVNIADYYVNHIYPEKVRLDLHYARQASFAGDCRILLQTFSAVFS
jgi:lipopolysaccharide/colanic/teichoic acid biosynthesis glycosyltransferase